MKKIRVLVVDDSATVRHTLKQVLESVPDIDVYATASDPYVAARHMASQAPDVVMLDVEMPRMDGLTFLDRIMTQHPLPVIICSTLTGEGSESAMLALARGAFDVVSKPTLGTKEFFEESRERLVATVRAAARVDPRKLRPRTTAIKPKLTADAVIPPLCGRAMLETTETVVAIGASTGGTEALVDVLSALPVDCPGIVVVQHMPERFTAQFAYRLDQLCSIRVKEAETGDSVLRGHALIAPGGKHTLLQRSGARYFVDVREGPLVSRHRPSVDVLFRSTARYAGKNGIGIILTGMGDDGAKGMKEMRDAGAHTMAQDEASCVVFGMPNEAIKAGGVVKVLPLDQISQEIVRASTRGALAS